MHYKFISYLRKKKEITLFIINASFNSHASKSLKGKCGENQGYHKTLTQIRVVFRPGLYCILTLGLKVFTCSRYC